MRDQIITGIHTAARTSTALFGLTSTEVDTLADAILAELATTPDDTPAPTLATITEDTPTLTISPAALVAILARDAWIDARDDHDTTTSEATTPLICQQTFTAGPDHRAVREYIFAVQAIFGCRTRIRILDGTPTFVVAGTLPQARALTRIVTTMQHLAADTVATMTPEDTKAFWATLGHLAQQTWRAQTLIAENAHTYVSATQYLDDTYGRTRNLARTAPVTTGALYDQAVAVMTDGAHQ